MIDDHSKGRARKSDDVGAPAFPFSLLTSYLYTIWSSTYETLTIRSGNKGWEDWIVMECEMLLNAYCSNTVWMEYSKSSQRKSMTIHFFNHLRENMNCIRWDYYNLTSVTWNSLNNLVLYSVNGCLLFWSFTFHMHCFGAFRGVSRDWWGSNSYHSQDLLASLIGITGNCYNWELRNRSGATCTLPPCFSERVVYECNRESKPISLWGPYWMRSPIHCSF